MRTFVFALVVSAVGACSWGGESSKTAPDAGAGSGGGGGSAHASCGDNICSATEASSGSCPADCGTGGGSGGSGGGGSNTACGDFVCDPTIGEDASSCPADCSGGGGGSGGSGDLDCSDQNVQVSCLLCELLGECDGVDADGCAACDAAGGGGGGGGGLGDLGCTGGAPDGTCDANEDPSVCPTDCQ